MKPLTLEHVTLRFSAGSAPLLDTTFEFPAAAAVWIRAGNGSGKTSLLKLLATLKAPSAGRYLINGVDVAELDFEELAPFRRTIGFGFEHDGLIASRSVRENLTLPFFRECTMSEVEIKQRVDTLLTCFGLVDVQARRSDCISGGLRKAALVARALITRPKLVILDDPTLGLDLKHRAALISELEAGFSAGWLERLIFATSDEEFAARFHPAVVTIAHQRLERAA